MSNISLITADIYSAKNGFESVLSDKSLNFEKEAAFAVQAVTKNQTILDVAMKNRQAVINAVQNIAAIGISLNPAKKQAYLIPRKNEICLDISYIGLMDLAMSTGSILWGQARIVRENDLFKLNKLDEAPTHQYNPFGKDRGDIAGVYVVVKTHTGDYLTHTMDIDSVYDIRARSESYKSGKGQSGPWVTDPEEMIKKTCVKQAYKYWPKTDRLEKAIHYLDTDGGEGITLENKEPDIDISSLLTEMKKTQTEDELKQFWKTKNSQLAKYPMAHARFKQAVIDHHAGLTSKSENISQQTQSNAGEVQISELTGGDHEIH